jgi:hypothetical protein
VKPLFPITVAALSLASAAFVATKQTQATTEPQRVIYTWNGNPATQAAFTWRTDAPVAQALIQFAPSSGDPRFTSTATTQNATSQPLELAEGPTAYYHTATLKGLKPKTKYSYRVGDGQSWSEWFDFTTASAMDDPFTFIYFGDAQNNIKSMWSRVIRQAQKDAPYADFMLHAGDLINIPEADKEWGEWFYAGGWLHSTIPSVATPGNHEYKSGKITRLWTPQFEYPRNGVPGLEETNYYIDFQGARIISLNSLEKTAEQAAWLDKTLGATKANWTILTFHYPMYSTAKGRDNKALRELWLPIILKHKVNLVLQGHDHSYGRMTLPHSHSSVPSPNLGRASEGLSTKNNSSSTHSPDGEGKGWGDQKNKNSRPESLYSQSVPSPSLGRVREGLSTQINSSSTPSSDGEGKGWGDQNNAIKQTPKSMASNPLEPLFRGPNITNLSTGATAQVGQTYFVVSVSGPKMYNVGEDALSRMTKTGEYKQLYQIISVTPTRITYRAHLANGELFDSFTIDK